MSDLLKAIFLGFIEGLTEFLPVSSTGHLVLAAQWLDFHSPNHVFEVFIQLGAIMAVVVTYRRKLFETLVGLPTEKTAQRFTLNIAAATLPALVAGALMHGSIKGLYTPVVIGTSLVLGGFVILTMERRVATNRIKSIDDITPRTALMIGLCQMIALIPGVSRSGATIMGGLALGLERKVAAEFSFFAAIPVMCAATLFDFLKNKEAIMQGDNLSLMLAGFAAAFVTALAVLKLAMHIISKFGFVPFAWYRIAAGTAVLLFFI